MTLFAAQGFLAAEPVRVTAAPPDDGGLIRYAERIARKREGARALPMYHLAPLARAYELAEEVTFARNPEKVPPVFEVHAAPVQHGKTSLIQAAILRTLRRNPRAWIAYPAYNAGTAIAKMYEVRQLAEGEGIHIDRNFDTGEEWRTVEGGGVMAAGIVGGPWTSRGFDLIIPDDPYKTSQDAYSGTWRAAVEHAFDTALFTRRRPWTSIVVNAARWHPSDLSGVLVKKGWRYVRLPAINAAGEPLWPQRWPLSELLAIRDGRPASEDRPAVGAIPRSVWASLYQGLPVPDGARIFEPGNLRTYDRLPEGPFMETIGIDVAYGAQARHDCSAIVGWRQYVAQPRDLYLVEPWLGHETLELFACRVAAAQIQRAGGPHLSIPKSGEIDQWRSQFSKPEIARSRRVLTWWYASGTEQGAVGMFSVYGANVHVERAGIDKVARAQGGYVDPSIGGYTSAWNEGRVWWPAVEGEHAMALRAQHEDFTGGPSDEDDGVDAAVAGHDAMQIRALLLEQERRTAALARRPAVASSGRTSIDGGRTGGMRW